MLFRILGSVEICGHGSVYRPARIQARLLCTLLVGRRQWLSVGTLVEEIWGGSAPRGAKNAVHVQVSRLRRHLGPLEPGVSAGRLETNKSGYRLMVEDDEIEAEGFRRQVREARESIGIVDRRRTAHMARAALSMWRGPVFAGLTRGPICQQAASRYEQARIHALEVLSEAELGLGNHMNITGEIGKAVALLEQPSERLYVQQILALYRSNRQADALNACLRAQQRLAMLGLPPSATLQFYLEAILRHDALLQDSTSGLVEVL